MKATAKQEITVTLELNLKEVKWLLSYTQNSVGGVEIEPDDQREIRFDIFNALKDSLRSVGIH